MNYFTGSETRQYNSLGQLTSLVASGTSNLNLTYNYAPGFNIGKITSMTDNITGHILPIRRRQGRAATKRSIQIWNVLARFCYRFGLRSSPVLREQLWPIHDT